LFVRGLRLSKYPEAPPFGIADGRAQTGISARRRFGRLSKNLVYQRAGNTLSRQQRLDLPRSASKPA
jgi:hypothetical protein